jgi:hypothetical protein
VAILVIVGVVLWVSGLNKLVVPLVGSLSVTSLALPFGPLLFAFAGRPAVPAVVKMWRKAKEAKKQFSLSLALLLGTFLPALTYLLFVVAVLTINPHVSPEALNGLFVSPVLRVVLGALGLLTIWTSYFMIGDNLKDILRFDFKLSRLWAGLIPVTLPFLLYLVGFKDFLTVISLTGGIFLALEGVFVVMMWRGAFRGHRWRWLTGLLYAVFVVALGYAVLGVVA